MCNQIRSCLQSSRRFLRNNSRWWPGSGGQRHCGPLFVTGGRGRYAVERRRNGLEARPLVHPRGEPPVRPLARRVTAFEADARDPRGDPHDQGVLSRPAVVQQPRDLHRGARPRRADPPGVPGVRGGDYVGVIWAITRKLGRARGISWNSGLRQPISSVRDS